MPNFDKVNDFVYRGGQPTAEGFKSLAALGVKTVIDLREIGERQGLILIALGFGRIGMHLNQQPVRADGFGGAAERSDPAAHADAVADRLAGVIDHRLLKT